ncbi:hypothetical protein KC329_g102 [Hortaea werneckii]|nr:hypothetical protein KC329_g102 [Hortaea werneckii]
MPETDKRICFSPTKRTRAAVPNGSHRASPSCHAVLPALTSAEKSNAISIMAYMIHKSLLSLPVGDSLTLSYRRWPLERCGGTS